MVLQPSQKVVKPDAETDYDRRLQALESQINELKSFLLLNEGDCLHKNNKEAQGKWARGDSNARPPPCEGLYFALQPYLTFFSGRGVEPPGRQVHHCVSSQKL